MPAGVLALIVALAMLLLLPFLLADAMVSALLELGIAPRVATLLVIGIFVGSLFNVPVWRRAGAAVLEYRPSDFFGLGRLAPRLVQPGARQVGRHDTGNRLGDLGRPAAFGDEGRQRIGQGFDHRIVKGDVGAALGKPRRSADRGQRQRRGQQHPPRQRPDSAPDP